MTTTTAPTAIITKRVRCSQCKRITPNGTALDAAECPLCGFRPGWNLLGESIKVRGITVASIECDALCQQATGTSCKCSCGGQNHGGA